MDIDCGDLALNPPSLTLSSEIVGAEHCSQFCIRMFGSLGILHDDSSNKLR